MHFDLTELAAYVTDISNGDPVKLVSSGFKLRKARGTATLSPITFTGLKWTEAQKRNYIDGILSNHAPAH